MEKKQLKQKDYVREVEFLHFSEKFVHEYAIIITFKRGVFPFLRGYRAIQ